MKFAKILATILTLCLAIYLLVACVYEEGSSPTNENPNESIKEKVEDLLSIGQKNALDKAKSYLKYSAFSREGLINQLDFEGFEEDDIIFAVDNVEVDWNEQCYEKAKSYLKYTSFSKEGLINQLEFEGFTDEEIAYAIAKVGYGNDDASQENAENGMTIGQKNALEKAKSYLKYTAFSREGLITQLDFEGFEEDDIIFAVDNVEVDWNEQCYEKAKSYLKYSSFSKQSLINQLEFEGFTDEQIAYAVEKVGY